MSFTLCCKKSQRVLYLTEMISLILFHFLWFVSLLISESICRFTHVFYSRLNILSPSCAYLDFCSCTLSICFYLFFMFSSPFSPDACVHVIESEPGACSCPGVQQANKLSAQYQARPAGKKLRCSACLCVCVPLLPFTVISFSLCYACHLKEPYSKEKKKLFLKLT